MNRSAPSLPRQLAAFASIAALSTALASCTPDPLEGVDSGAKPAAPAEAPTAAEELAVDDRPEEAPAPVGVVAAGEAQKTFAERADAWFTAHPTKRIYIQLDKPIYQPGETIWLRTTALKSATFTADQGEMGVSYQLVSPKGSVVLQKRVKQISGVAHNDFELPEGVQGGEYTIRVTSDDGAKEERSLIVSVYEAPRFKKKLDFIRKAYGAGDTVAATVEVKRPTGEPFVNRALTGVLTLDGAELPRVRVKTDAKGACVVRVKLPQKIDRGDGILTVMVEDSGITESITKRVPIVLDKLKVSFFPEGGELVQGLPSRVYFAAQNMIDKPADVEGKVVDDHGQTMATFRSFHDGMGRFDLTPATGRTYFAEITKPVGVTERYQLPLAQEKGCTLRTYDDVKSAEKTIRLAVNCTEPRTVLANAMVREARLGTATVEVSPGKQSVAHLTLERANMQGVARITLFSETMEPLAERLFFRGWHRDLKITVKPDRERYAPRDQVTLTVETRDLAGEPVAAALAMAVVDDTVLSFADDKTAHLLTHMLLEEELPGKIEEPNFYFKEDKPKSARALDMLLGTRGWRKFEWRPVLTPPQPVPTGATTPQGLDMVASREATPAPDPMVEGEARPENEPKGALRARPKKKNGEGRRMKKPAPRRRAARGPQPRDVAKRKALPPPAEHMKEAQAPQPVVAAPMDAEEEIPAPRVGRGMAEVAADDVIGGKIMAAGEEIPEVLADEEDRDWARADKAEVERQLVTWAKVRVFPVPTYQPGYDGPRTDFRETIYWNPAVETDARGKASVTFFLSDAVTSFRVTTEGFATTGLAGRVETVFQSKLPFFMNVKLPLEVSAGDLMNLPLTLKNETGRALSVSLASTFGDQIKLLENVAPGQLDLGSASGRTLSYPLEVVGKMGASEVRFAAEAQGLKDEFKRTLKVVPLGFPRNASASGELKRSASHILNLKGALDGSLLASVTFYPSPAAEMISGVESILREPYGCFEQASSSNYPNIMVMQYLQERDTAPAAIVERSSKLLEQGYRKLVGYESPKKGYEWFGGDPGHEALSAYGLMEFVDMVSVYGGVDRSMIERTKEWLYSRRDGKGGFQRNPRALDSFGGANKEVTDAYIVWALTEARLTDLPKELEAVAALGQKSTDPYVVALAAGSQLNVNRGGSVGKALAKKLAKMQQDDGRFHGTTHSITRSGGQGLDVETTSLAILALLKAGGHRGPVDKAVKWLTAARGGSGGFGSTQATILALKAMVAFDKASRRTTAGGKIVVKINGDEAGTLQFEKGRTEAIVLDDLGKALLPGENTVELVLNSTMPLPYSLSVDYRTDDPATSPEVPLALETSIAKPKVKMGETVRVVAKLQSTSDEGLPMTLVRIGIPGGLTYQTWQLKELVDKKLVAFYETRAREVILYFRSLPPRAKKEIAVDLVANVPGTYTAPASRAYLYYTAEHKAWASPLKVQIDL